MDSLLDQVAAVFKLVEQVPRFCNTATMDGNAVGRRTSG